MRLRTLLLTLALCLVGLPAHASPIGFDYGVLLDADVTDDIDAFDTEGHAGSVVFDDAAETVPNDIVPSPPLAPGFDLLVSEMVMDNQDGTETISIWVESAEDPGVGPLFANPLDPFGFIFFEVDSLFWDQGPGEVVDYVVTLSFGTALVEAALLAEDVGGDGFNSPLFLDFELDPFQILDLEDQLGPWTDLHLDIVIAHADVPEPSLLALVGISGLALLAKRRRS